MIVIIYDFALYSQDQNKKWKCGMPVHGNMKRSQERYHIECQMKSEYINTYLGISYASFPLENPAN